MMWVPTDPHERLVWWGVRRYRAGLLLGFVLGLLVSAIIVGTII